MGLLFVFLLFSLLLLDIWGWNTAHMVRNRAHRPTSTFGGGDSCMRRLASSGGGEGEEQQKEDTQGAEDSSRRISWQAQVTSSVQVKETNRSAEAYMALPASEYSVLSADQIERLSDSQFKATLGKMNFFGNIIIPVLYVDVNVFADEARAEIVVSRAETVGSDVAEKVNGTFSISAVNKVSAGLDDKGRKILTSDTSLSIDIIVPKDAKLPVRVIRSGGNFLMQQSLNIIVPTFVRVLAADFKRWSAGSDERNAVEGATLAVT